MGDICEDSLTVVFSHITRLLKNERAQPFKPYRRLVGSDGSVDERALCPDSTLVILHDERCRASLIPEHSPHRQFGYGGCCNPASTSTTPVKTTQYVFEYLVPAGKNDKYELYDATYLACKLQRRADGKTAFATIQHSSSSSSSSSSGGSGSGTLLSKVTNLMQMQQRRPTLQSSTSSPSSAALNSNFAYSSSSSAGSKTLPRIHARVFRLSLSPAFHLAASTLRAISHAYASRVTATASTATPPSSASSSIPLSIAQRIFSELVSPLCCTVQQHALSFTMMPGDVASLSPLLLLHSGILHLADLLQLLFPSAFDVAPAAGYSGPQNQCDLSAFPSTTPSTTSASSSASASSSSSTSSASSSSLSPPLWQARAALISVAGIVMSKAISLYVQACNQSYPSHQPINAR